MNMQTKAGFKKEILAFFRTSRFLILALVILGLGMLSPLLITAMGSLMDSMSDLYNEMGMDVSDLTDMLGSSASIGVSSSVGDITGVGLIVYLLLINKAAGGEQKKRAVIIPRSAGLRSFGYIFPKFIIYPLSAFALAVVAMFASWGVSSIVFDYNDVTFGGVLLSGTLAGVCMMFYVCFHLALGTATGKAGMSAAVCIGASVILPSIFAFTTSDYMFNPFALDNLAGTIILQPNISGEQLRDIFVTIGFALGLMVLAYLIALFAQNARKIDNSGNEIEL
ncbi:MAG: hypothetical protein FWD44_10180 [Oscillospiraceae bacterium]|nr:hypothetical protein [Oscillospiraceae bacterium]